mmetsp:Transcript_38504/g.28350  ORF Transcript_38504/g.28350 Transcript_38504/m.28350 type:complete len:403 (+) Transcript_38504:10-1218(+)
MKSSFVLLLVVLSSLTFAHKAAEDESSPIGDNLKFGHEAESAKDEFKLEIPDGPADFQSPNKPLSFYANKYWYECVWVCVFGVALVVFFRGKDVSEQVAEQWKKACLEVISKNFAHFGLEKETSTALEKTSYSEFLFYASGRVNTLYALFKFELRKRHCLFTSCCFDLVWPSKDLVTIDIPISVPEYSLQDGSTTNLIPLDMVICRKRDMKAMYSNFSYMKNFLAPLQAKNLKQDLSSSNSLVVLGESEESVNHMIDGQIGQVLSEIGEEHIQSVHITDQKLYNNSPLMLRAQLHLIPAKPKESARILSTLFQLVDRSVGLRLSTAARQRAEKSRKKVEKERASEEKERKEEEVLKKKREEELRYNEMLKKLSPEEQRKLEEKKHKKEVKKNQSKMQKFVKM